MPPGRPKKSQRNALMKSAELIGWAIGGIEREIAQTRERLAALTAQAMRLRKRAGIRGTAGVSGGSAGAGPSTAGGTRRRRKMSPEARKRISEMMKKRWAERRRARSK